MYKRKQFAILLQRINEKRKFIQFLTGPRQTGKTTLARQILEHIKWPTYYASADDPSMKGKAWIEQHWENARLKSFQEKRKTLLIFDEIQKIPDWSEAVKKLWDEDTLKSLPIRVVLLGSSPLLLQKGLTESLAGRFEVVYMPHWSFEEMHRAFKWDVETFIYFGGYPGAAEIISQEDRWRQYILDSFVETTISRDVLLMTRVDKPALLRGLFELGCSFSGQILSYQKMLGQLHGAGNTTTLAHYLQLLDAAGLLTGLQKYAANRVRQRASSPKLLVLNTALMSAFGGSNFQDVKNKPEIWGRFVESAIGASLVNKSRKTNIRIYYWRDRNKEVDFVLEQGQQLIAVEVKSTKKKMALPGMEAFANQFPVQKKFLVGSEGIPVEEFLTLSPEELFG